MKPNAKSPRLIGSSDLLAVAAGQEYKNPYDGPGGGPTIRVVHVEGDDAVCCWRYADSPNNALKAFVKSCASILEDWHLIPSANDPSSATAEPKGDNEKR